MKIELSPYAYRQYKKLPLALQSLIKMAISKLAIDPFPPGVKKLSGRVGFRLRYGDYRIIYMVDEGKQIVTILAIAHRREVYLKK